MSSLAIAASALSGAYGRFDRAAGEVLAAAPTGDLASLSQAFVGMAEAKTDVRAAAAVLRTADQMTGALLDIKT